jgi:phospholipid/cholesterol/gamma-HCH transport system substrate-binding protein
MMKISNETKVGALTAISITLLILGFNFLKGKNVFEKKATMYVTFKRVEGLNIADGIKINGLRVGAVEGLEEKDANLSEVVVAFQLVKEINIPTDSYAKIVATPLGSTAIVITMGNAKTFLNEGDTLTGMESKSMVEDLKETLQPTVENVNKTLATLDSTIRKIGNVFDANAKQNIGSTLEELALTTSRLNTLLEPNKGSLAQTLENVKGFTGNLKQNNDSITAVVNNLTKASRDLASADISKTISSLEKATTTLNTILADIKEGKGSLGKLATDEQLYKNLNSTSNSLNVLIQDLRLHPKRYVQVSVFGKKDKTGPLMAPLPDSLSKQ